MNNERSAPAQADRSVALAENAWSRFWFTPIPTTGLQCLRVLCGLLFFLWLFSFVGHQVELFSLSGWLDRAAFDELRGQDLAPNPIGWSILYIAPDNLAFFQAMYWGSLLVLLLFTLGVATRITSVLTWVIVVSFFANPVTRYEGDYLLGILAFYLMIGHALKELGPLRVPLLLLASFVGLLLAMAATSLGIWPLLAAVGIGVPFLIVVVVLLAMPMNDHLSLAERFLGSRHDFVLAPWLFPSNTDRPASHGANLMMRLLQIHVAIVIVTSALHKLHIVEWLGGVALWYPLHPTFKTTLESLQREMPNRDFTLFYLSVAGYAVLAWQLCFPVFAWRTGKWRVLLLGGAGIGWLGAFFLFGAPLFGPFVLLGSLSFLHPEEWAWALERVRAKFARPAQSIAEPEPKKVVMAATKESIKK